MQLPSQTIYGLCDPDDSEVRYIGRASKPAERLRMHLAQATDDESPKGVWLNCLKREDQPPKLVILESTSLPPGNEAVTWAKNREKQLIHDMCQKGHDLLNHGCWWNHPGRKAIPRSTRFAWIQLNHIFFRISHWLSEPGRDDAYLESTQFQAVRAIESLVAQYPALEVRPLACYRFNTD